MKSSRAWEVLLYPDATNYDCGEVLATAAEYFEQWAYICHDRDVTSDGQPKKAHFHFYGKMATPYPPQTIANKLGVGLESLRNVSRWKAALRYLIHADNPEKAQYEPEEVAANIPLDGIFTVSDDNQARLILQHIIETGCTSTIELLDWALANGCYSGLRRGYAIWSQVLKENTNNRKD